jgi:gliding motility-associated-like protein
VESPKNGTFTVDDNGVFVYQSDRYFRGEETFVYEVCDNEVPQLCSQAAALVVIDDLPLKPYEGFSPNGDGFNDYWRIDGIDYYRNNKVRVFDRYNNLVFAIDGYNNEDKIWRGEGNHGIIDGRLLEGTYFYSIELGDGSKPISGFMVLKRD